MYRISDPASGNGFSVAPAMGANLLSLRFAGENILDGHTDPESLQQNAWGKSALLFPFPNRLRDGRYGWGGKTYQFPLNNADTGNAIHGFVSALPFTVYRIFLGKDKAEIACRLRYDGHNPAYPFPFVLDASYCLDKQNRFVLTVTVGNTHDGPIPMGFGWHPYFRLPAPLASQRLRIPQCDQVGIDQRMLPTGQTRPFPQFTAASPIGDQFLDHCFRVSGEEETWILLLAGPSKSLSIRCDKKAWPYFQIFTPPHRQSIALEPMTCNIDALNNRDGLLVLAPGESWRAALTLTYE